jgi:hypothetical protein
MKLMGNHPPITGQVSVTTSGVQIYSGGVKPDVGLQIKSLTANGALIYVGKQGVTSSNGYPLDPGEPLFIPASEIHLWYAVSASGTLTLAYLLI